MQVLEDFGTGSFVLFVVIVSPSCRPLFAEEQKAGEKIVLRVDESEAGVKMRSPGHGGMEQYYFDGTFGPEATQEQVYMRAAKPIVDNVLRGMNTCMFAYGQTGTGALAVS
jgi:hypothetical protein